MNIYQTVSLQEGYDTRSIFLAACSWFSVMVIVVKMQSTIQIQILDEAFLVLRWTNVLGEGMNPFFSFS